MTDTDTITVVYRYHDIDDIDFMQVTMASKEDRRASVVKLFPDYVWNDEESILGNWRDAVAEESGCTSEQVKAAMQDYLGEYYNNRTLSRYVWFLA